jgi:hypothetical protein
MASLRGTFFIFPILLATVHSQLLSPHPLFGGSNGNDGKLHLPGITIGNPFPGAGGGNVKVNDPGGNPPLETDFKGLWELVSIDSGANAMHINLLPNNKVIMYDATAFHMSTIKLPNGECFPYKTDQGVEKQDCWCHAVEFDIDTAQIRPLKVFFSPFFLNFFFCFWLI